METVGSLLLFRKINKKNYLNRPFLRVAKVFFFVFVKQVIEGKTGHVLPLKCIFKKLGWFVERLTLRGTLFYHALYLLCLL